MRLCFLEIASREKRSGQFSVNIDIVGVDLQSSLILGNCLIQLAAFIKKRAVGKKEQGGLGAHSNAGFVFTLRLISLPKPFQKIGVTGMNFAVMWFHLQCAL